MMIRSSIKNPCPVCDRTKDKDCSWYPDELTVMYKTYCDGTGHDDSKWHYQGVNKLGFQGKFLFKTEQEFVTDNSDTKEQLIDRIITPSQFQEIISRSTESDSGKSTRPHFTTS